MYEAQLQAQEVKIHSQQVGYAEVPYLLAVNLRENCDPQTGRRGVKKEDDRSGEN